MSEVRAVLKLLIGIKNSGILNTSLRKTCREKITFRKIFRGV